MHKTGCPVLVGTISIEKSRPYPGPEKVGINHQVLNAKYHEQEGRLSPKPAVGHGDDRYQYGWAGTDIILGGNAEALARELLKKRGNPDAAIPEEVGRR